MATPATFLRALAHALELRQRERVDAAIRRAADDACAVAIQSLASAGRSVFRFTPEGVEYGPLPLTEFDGWIWAERLASMGIERLELLGPTDTANLAAFLDYAAGLMPEGPPPRLGHVGLRWGPLLESAQDGGQPYPLADEFRVMQHVFAAATRGDRLPLGDVHAVVASLGSLVSEEEQPTLSLLHRRGRGDYQPAHALNCALLALILADALDLGPEERRECALAALLHDIGMARMPADTLVGDRFTPQDRARVRGHPMEGARLLLRHGDVMESAAVVSYEHHLRPDGGGYPRLSYPREPHLLSRVVAVCDAFDALLAPRPDRSPLGPAGAIHELERSAVAQFDPRVVTAFSDRMMRSAEAGGLVLTLRGN
jgi:hypothetical protein